MLESEILEQLRQMRSSSYGVALREYLDMRMARLSDVTTCDSWEEALGRKRAIAIMNEIFSFIDDKEGTTRKNQYL